MLALNPSRLLSFVGGLVAMMGVSAIPAHAGQITTDTILYQDLGGTINVFFNGSPFGSCLVENAGCATTSEQGGGTGIPTFGGSTFPININIYDDIAHTLLSDTFSLSVQDFSGIGGTPNTVESNFLSEVSGVPLTPLSGGTVISLDETGLVQDLGTMTFVDSNGGPISAIDYQFVSDELAAVPEPSSLPLLGAGLLGLIGLGCRTARKNSAPVVANSAS